MSDETKGAEVDAARAAAEKYLAENPDGMSIRSCWNCNGAHEHLKKAPNVICCFACNHWFFAGVDITATDEEAEATRE